MNEPTAHTPNQAPAQKQRHGCLTAYLILMIIANSLVALMYLPRLRIIHDIRMLQWARAWAFPVLIVAGVFNVVCAIALLRWKKWGFWGFAVSTVIIFSVNLSIGLDIWPALLGLLGLPILYGVLHIGKEKKGWSQLG